METDTVVTEVYGRTAVYLSAMVLNPAVFGFQLVSVDLGKLPWNKCTLLMRKKYLQELSAVTKYSIKCLDFTNLTNSVSNVFVVMKHTYDVAYGFVMNNNIELAFIVLGIQYNNFVSRSWRWRTRNNSVMLTAQWEHRNEWRNDTSNGWRMIIGHNNTSDSECELIYEGTPNSIGTACKWEETLGFNITNGFRVQMPIPTAVLLLTSAKVLNIDEEITIENDEDNIGYVYLRTASNIQRGLYAPPVTLICNREKVTMLNWS